MAKINFDIPTRFDEEQAREGVWFEVEDEHDQLWGEFKLAYLDGDAPDVKKLRTKLKAKYAKDIRLGKLDQDKVAMEIFLSYVLLDWRKVKAGGKAVPFSKEAAEAYFEMPQVKSFAWPVLLQYAGDVRWYNDKAAEQGVDPVTDKDETLGNS